MKKRLLNLAILGISLGVPFKVFMDKADEAAADAYQQGQVQLAQVNINKLKLLQGIKCAGGLDLGTYFQQKAREKGFEPYVAAIIPQESAGDVYATGCDPCPSEGIKTKRHDPRSLNWQWLQAVFNNGLHSLCLRKNATISNTCTVGFGLMQITSHTISESKYQWIVQPWALQQTKAKAVKYSGNYSAVNEEPKESPYNPCTNIDVGLSILEDKYKACSGYKDPTKRMACAVCYYNGRTDYLEHIRRTVIDRGQAGLLVRVGFIKDGMLEGLRKFLVDVASFFGGSKDYCTNVF
uniref:Transglycosylase SLT domain-containing protein n=1 Tax=Thermocrinis ruber TaxID=75906 RepID=A0A7C5SZ92_9AQUI